MRRFLIFGRVFFVWYATLGLLIAIFWKSKNEHYREVAKLGVAPVLFNIGEPVMYGLPTVLNPLLFIPFIVCPAVMSSVAYIATSLGLVAPVTQNVTWVMPPVLYGFFSTGFDWRAIVLSLVNLALATLITFHLLRWLIMSLKRQVSHFVRGYIGFIWYIFF